MAAPRAVRTAGAPAVPAGVAAVPDSQRSSEDAGYQVTLPDLPDRAVAATLRVPTVTCPSAGDDGIYPTAELLDSARAGVVGVGIAIVCDDGSVTYESADAYAGATNQALAVAPGDVVQITVQAGPDGESANVEDVTAGTNTSATADAVSHGPAYALIGVAPVLTDHRAVDAPDFGSVPFSGATVDGLALARTRNLVKLTREGRRHAAIWTSPLSAHGESFTTSQLP